jgi:hypothetical protein
MELAHLPFSIFEEIILPTVLAICAGVYDSAACVGKLQGS